MTGKRARSQRRRGANRAATPHVGIIYLVGDKLWIDATPVARAGNFGDFSFHERYHCQYWEQLVKQRTVPDTEYEHYSRGRVSYNRNSGKYTLLADPCILRENNLVATIFLQMNLPARDTETGTDSVYRCFRCLGRSR
jgi:hypothetical protein